MRSDMVPGAIFPDYELSDHTAKHRKLSELQGQDPMVLVLSRGAFCPKDRRQAEGLLQLHREMEVGYCRLVTITSDNIIQTNEYRSGVGAPDLAVRQHLALRIQVGQGQGADLALKLPAGHYMLICNLPGHYKVGMHTAFTVTP